MFQLIDQNSYNVKVQTATVIEGEVTNTERHSLRESELVLYAADLESLFDYVKEHYPTPKRGAESSRKKSESWSSDFYKLEDYETAIDIFQNHPEQIRTFSPREELTKIENNAGTTVDYDVWGDFVDIGRFLEGVPEVYGQFTMGNPLGLFATITVNATAVCWVKEETINLRAQRILRLVDWLENQNIRCSIRVISSTGCQHVEAQIKDFGDSFDINSLAVIAHSDFFRRILFRITEYSDTYQVGYGKPYRFSEIDVKNRVPDHGINIDIDWFEHTEQVDKAFDSLENKLEKMIEDGETRFHTIVKP